MKDHKDWSSIKKGDKDYYPYSKEAPAPISPKSFKILTAQAKKREVAKKMTK